MLPPRDLRSRLDRNPVVRSVTLVTPSVLRHGQIQPLCIVVRRPIAGGRLRCKTYYPGPASINRLALAVRRNDMLQVQPHRWQVGWRAYEIVPAPSRATLSKIRAQLEAVRPRSAHERNGS